MASVTLRSVEIDLPVYDVNAHSLRKSALSFATGGRLYRNAGQRTFVRALAGVSLNLQSGDRLGIVGGNGAGKSTLLRVIGGIYPPTRGIVSVQGRVSTMIDIGAGIDPDATGSENIVIRGMFMGHSLKEIKARQQAIEEFSELGPYLRLPVKTYSSGMAMRLAFSISTELETDVLIIDEWLSAGDAHFSEKAQRRFREMTARADIIVLASHSIGYVRDFATKVAWLDHGVLKALGDPAEVVDAYLSETV